MFWKVGICKTHWIQYPSTESLFFPGTVLKQDSGRPNISGLVQKISKDIVQLTLGFCTSCVVRWHFAFFIIPKVSMSIIHLFT